MADNEKDLETCSWCLAEVEDSTLKEQPDGARICPDCERKRRAAIDGTADNRR